MMRSAFFTRVSNHEAETPRLISGLPDQHQQCASRLQPTCGGLILRDGSLRNGPQD